MSYSPTSHSPSPPFLLASIRTHPLSSSLSTKPSLVPSPSASSFAARTPCSREPSDRRSSRRRSPSPSASVLPFSHSQSPSSPLCSPLSHSTHFSAPGSSLSTTSRRHSPRSLARPPRRNQMAPDPSRCYRVANHRSSRAVSRSTPRSTPRSNPPLHRETLSFPSSLAIAPTRDDDPDDVERESRDRSIVRSIDRSDSNVSRVRPRDVRRVFKSKKIPSFVVLTRERTIDVASSTARDRSRSSIPDSETTIVSNRASRCAASPIPDPLHARDRRPHSTSFAFVIDDEKIIPRPRRPRRVVDDVVHERV